MALPDRDRIAATHCEKLILPAATSLWRIYPRAGEHPGQWNAFRKWGPLESARFDHHLEPPSLQDRSILYAAIDHPHCAVAEVFQGTKVINPWHADQPHLAHFWTGAELTLLDLTSNWIHEADGDWSDLLSKDRSLSRAWSRAIYDAYPDVQGLYFLSKLRGTWRNVALYDRAVTAIPGQAASDVALASPGLLPMLEYTASLLKWLVAPPPSS